MTTIRAAAVVIGIITAIALTFTPVSEASMCLAFILALCFIVATWPSTPVPPVVEARRWDELDPTAHLSTLDRLDGVGNRTTDHTNGSHDV